MMRRRFGRAVACVGVAAAVAGLLALGSTPASAQVVSVEAESGTGAGQVMSRSQASAQRDVWLHAGESRQMNAVVASGTFTVAVRYSNDNWGPLETVSVTVDGRSAGQFQAQDTGDYGYGWNSFLWGPSLNAGSLSAGSHVVGVSVTGGDGYGTEIDLVALDTSQQVEAESGTGAGQVMTRSQASAQRDVWLHAGESRQMSAVVASGTFTVAVRYSNDNSGAFETVSVTVDGRSIGQFQALDTGDYGYGWNSFVWATSLNAGSLSAGSHVVAVSVAGGDGYGTEIDVVRLDRTA